MKFTLHLTQYFFLCMSKLIEKIQCFKTFAILFETSVLQIAPSKQYFIFIIIRMWRFVFLIAPAISRQNRSVRTVTQII